jgi:hypothetical protein
VAIERLVGFVDLGTDCTPQKLVDRMIRIRYR